MRFEPSKWACVSLGLFGLLLVGCGSKSEDSATPVVEESTEEPPERATQRQEGSAGLTQPGTVALPLSLL